MVYSSKQNRTTEFFPGNFPYEPSILTILLHSLGTRNPKSKFEVDLGKVRECYLKTKILNVHSPNPETV